MKVFSRVKFGNEKFPALTGIRIIAACMVFLAHLPLNLKPGFLIGLQLSFHWSMALFFVLSGFVITYRYLGKAKFSGSFLRGYFIKRIARVYPLYFLVLTAVILVQGNFEPVFLIQNYTLTQNLFFIFPSQGTAIPPSWSLTVEECFYLLAPIIFILTKKHQLLFPFLLTLFLLAVILLTYANGLNFREGAFAVINGSFFGWCVAFYAGIYLAQIQLHRERNGRLPRTTKAYTIAGITGMAALSMPLVYVTNQDDAVKYPVMALVSNFLMAFPIALFFYGLANERTLVKRMLSGNFMQLLGRSTYAFYLIHYPLIHFLVKPFIQPGDPYYNLCVLATLLFTIILSILLFVFFEHPVNLFLRQKCGAVRPTKELATAV